MVPNLGWAYFAVDLLIAITHREPIEARISSLTHATHHTAPSCLYRKTVQFNSDPDNPDNA